MNKKTQAAVELAMVFTFAFLFFSFFIVAIFDNSYVFRKENTVLALQDIINYLKQEFDFANDALPGYSSNFTLPAKIMNLNYTANLTVVDNLTILAISFPDSGISSATYAFDYIIKGEIKPGVNFIKKEVDYVNIT